MQAGGPHAKGPSLLDKVIRFSLENKLVVGLLVLFVTAFGIMVAPFDWEVGDLPRDPIAVDAIHRAMTGLRRTDAVFDGLDRFEHVDVGAGDEAVLLAAAHHAVW